MKIKKKKKEEGQAAEFSTTVSLKAIDRSPDLHPNTYSDRTAIELWTNRTEKRLKSAKTR